MSDATAQAAATEQDERRGWEDRLRGFLVQREYDALTPPAAEQAKVRRIRKRRALPGTRLG